MFTSYSGAIFTAVFVTVYSATFVLASALYPSVVQFAIDAGAGALTVETTFPFTFTYCVLVSVLAVPSIPEINVKVLSYTA